jgi:hypothetical protein
MEITAIEKKTFEQMQRAFASFANQIKNLCNSKVSDKWLNNRDVCGLLQISLRTLQSHRDTGTLPFSQIGHKCYYKVNNIEEFINQQIKNKKDEK